jgi:hypothetical protein
VDEGAKRVTIDDRWLRGIPHDFVGLVAHERAFADRGLLGPLRTPSLRKTRVDPVHPSPPGRHGFVTARESPRQERTAGTSPNVRDVPGFGAAGDRRAFVDQFADQGGISRRSGENLGRASR